MEIGAIKKLLSSLADMLAEKQLEEVEYEENGVRVRVKRGGTYVTAAGALPAAQAATAPTPAPVAAAAAPAHAAPAAPAEEAGLVTVKSPIVGTYYESASPGAPEFVRAGDRVETGQVLCIIEAMKLMNEIEAEIAGVVVRKLATNGQPVEYGQPLLVIRPA